MPAIGFAVPVVPGKEEQDRQYMAEAVGPRRDDAEAAWRRHGITRHAVFQQETPAGTFAVVFIEADDIDTAMQGLASSDDPFDQWFRGTIKEIHGIDLEAGAPPPSQQLFDVQL